MLRTLMRDFFAVAACTLGGAFPGLLQGQTESRPNLIFILADDLGSESVEGPNDIWDNRMGCETPTLYRMSEIGVSFPNCRVNPNCSPTRAGLMTGRRALSTGVTGVLAHFFRGKINPCDPDLVLLYDQWAQATDLTSVQAYERTIAEALQDNDYYTILIDKWHIGGDHYGEQAGGDDRGSSPDEQGFDAVRNWKDYICLDNKNSDEDTDHMVGMAGMAADLANGVSNQPYALFFHTITPHRRVEDDLGYKWYKVNDSLIPLTETLSTNPSNENRFIQNVEAINTVIREDLLFELDVITSTDPDVFEYFENGEPTVVFFLGDNGTDMEVSYYNSAGGPGDPDTDNHAKSSPYEGGIRVPLIVFGEGISGTALEGEVDYRLISHLDFFDTIADVAGLTESERVNPSGEGPVLPRHGASFADSIGYDVEIDLGENAYTLSFLGMQEPHHARASFVSNDGYKLIVRGGGTGDAFLRLTLER